ncbi:MAG: hypothetical protein K5668_04930 [Lachnospiraceae bacterium]|nr:hypothetical protein [Lachnospiraceae bacterium]
MDKKNFNLLDEDNLKMVTGGTQDGSGANNSLTGQKVSFYCKECGNTFDIVIGEPIVKCTNPLCGKEYNIMG